jgi:hypothetical protein
MKQSRYFESNHIFLILQLEDMSDCGSGQVCLRRDVSALSHRLSVLKAALGDLAIGSASRAKAGEECGKEVEDAQKYMDEVKEVR